MASRSCSRSSLHSESSTHSDRASPTPSHASAVSATSSTYEPPKRKPYGKYHIDMSFVPKAMKWTDVLSYVKKHTNIVDKAIAADITNISLKNGPGLYQNCTVAFQTEQKRDHAYVLLNKTRELVQGKKIFVKKWFREVSSHTQSSRPYSDTRIHVPYPFTKPYGEYHIRIVNVPKFMDVFSYVKRQTDPVDKAIAEDINFIPFKRSRGPFANCLIAFKTEQMRDKAFELLKRTKEKVEGKKLFFIKTNNVPPGTIESSLHSESITHSDRASPTPSHASAVSAKSSKRQRPKNKPYGKYNIKLNNTPNTYVWQDVLSYVKRHTDPVDKEIAEDITFIRCKKGKGLYADCSVAFQTEQIRDRAFDLLKTSNEKVEGKKIYVFKTYNEPPNCIDSSLHSDTHSDRASPTPSHASAVSDQQLKNKPYGKYLIKLTNSPNTMKWQDLLSFVKKHTDAVDKAIAEDITFFPCKKGPGIVPERSIAFQSQQMRDIAFELLKKSKEKFEGKTISVTKGFRVPPGTIDSSLHSESITHSDGASPTPSHASAVSTTTYQTPNKPYGNYHIKLSNVPNTMKCRDVLFYVKRHTDRVDKAIAQDITFIPIKKCPGFFQECSLEFKTEQMRDQAFELLKQSAEKIQGKKILVHKTSGGFLKDRNVTAPDPPQETIDSSLLIENNEETYGLSFEYLNDLGITPPLLRDVFVQFLPIDYDELKVQRLFNMAGNVVTVNLVKKNEFADAIVEFEHPVEAVQAISMFNNQMMFGTKIKCTLFNNNYTDETFVPGPGLGPNGTPLKGIHLAIQLKKITAEILVEFKEIQDSIDELNSQISSIQKKSAHTSYNTNQTTANTQSHWQLSSPNKQMNTRFGFQQNNNKRSRSRGVDNTRLVVLFYNLPHKMTQDALLSKVREIGEVKFIRMRSPGKALVCFFTDTDVNKCITLLDRCKVNGQFIRVKKIVLS